LGERDARRARQGMVRLLATPAETLDWLRRHLKPVVPVVANLDELPRRLADLDADDFDTREAASRWLESLGRESVPLLERALRQGLSTEQRRRVEAVLTRQQTARSSSDGLRGVRALQVLEGLGTPEALALVEELARGDRTHPLTREARGSLFRLRGR